MRARRRCVLVAPLPSLSPATSHGVCASPLVCAAAEFVYTYKIAADYLIPFGVVDYLVHTLLLALRAQLQLGNPANSPRSRQVPSWFGRPYFGANLHMQHTIIAVGDGGGQG